MKELSRRAMCNKTGGMTCHGYETTCAIDAEIVVEDEQVVVYLSAQWVDIGSDTILFQATTESLFDVEEHIYEVWDDDYACDEAVVKRDQISESKKVSKIFGDVDIYDRYSEQYDQLLQMLQDTMDKNDISFNVKTLSWG